MRLLKLHSKYWGLAGIFIGISLFVSTQAEAIGTLILISSATYDSGSISDYAKGVATDAEGNIIVTGQRWGGATNTDYFTIKYDKNLNFISSVVCNRNVNYYDRAEAVAVDKRDGSVIVTGYSGSGTPNWDFFTIKYNSSLSVVLASATYKGSIDESDEAYGVAVDREGNIFVVGRCDTEAGGSINYDIVTVKYDENLNFISSATYNGATDENDYGQAVTVDGEGNIIVTGQSQSGSDSIFVTIKYNNNLNFLFSATYNYSNLSDVPRAVAVDGEDNIIVTGRSDAANPDWYTIKYDKNLNELYSARYNGSANDDDRAWGVAVDLQGNIIVTGFVDSDPSVVTNPDYYTIKYNSDLSVVLASATYSLYGEAETYAKKDYAYALTVDDDGNIIVTGYIDTDTGVGDNYDWVTIKYLGPPIISSLSPLSGEPGETLDLTISGKNFYNGATVLFSGSGISVNSVDFQSSTELKVNITVSESATGGKRAITVTNIDEASGTKLEGFEIEGEEELPEEEEELIDDEIIGELEPVDKVIDPSKGEDSTIDFKIGEGASPGEEKTVRVIIKIYNLKGELIKTVFDKYMPVGTHRTLWDGKNFANEVVASGIYLVHIEAGNFKDTKKIVVIK